MPLKIIFLFRSALMARFFEKKKPFYNLWLLKDAFFFARLKWQRKPVVWALAGTE